MSGDVETVGGVSEMLDRHEENEAERHPECCNVWCDEPAPCSYRENRYKNSFRVCRDCLEILEA